MREVILGLFLAGFALMLAAAIVWPVEGVYGLVHHLPSAAQAGKAAEESIGCARYGAAFLALAYLLVALLPKGGAS